jgi:hypothetical protein
VLAPRLGKSRLSPVRAGASAAGQPRPLRDQRAAAVWQRPDLTGRAMQEGHRAVLKRSCKLRPPSRQRDQAQIPGQADGCSRRTTWLPMGRPLTQPRRSYSMDGPTAPAPSQGVEPPEPGGSNRRPSRGSCQTRTQVPYSCRAYVQVLSECSKAVGSSVACTVRRPVGAPTGVVKGDGEGGPLLRADGNATHVRWRAGRPVRVTRHSQPRGEQGSSPAYRSHRR